MLIFYYKRFLFQCPFLRVQFTCGGLFVFVFLFCAVVFCFGGVDF